MPFNLATAIDPPPATDEHNFGGDISSIIIDPNAIDAEEEEDEDPVIGEPPAAIDVIANNKVISNALIVTPMNK